MVALINAKLGKRGRVLFIRAGLRRRKMLKKMGIYHGAIVEVISDAGPGGVWIKTKRAQISLSRKTAGDIYMVFIA